LISTQDGALGQRRDGVQRPGLAADAPLAGHGVLVPRDGVVVRGRGDDVDVAVAVEVAREGAVGAVGERGDDARREGPVEPE